MSCLPVTIARPSIVTPRLDGDLRAHFLGLLGLYVDRRWRWVPGSGKSLVDLVEVDRVAHALVALVLAPPLRQRWVHIACGESAATLGELGEIARAAWKLRPLRFLTPAIVRAPMRVLALGSAAAHLRRAAPLAAYLNVRTPVDTTRSAPILAARGVQLRPAAMVFGDLVARLRDREGRHPDGRCSSSRPPAPTRLGVVGGRLSARQEVRPLSDAAGRS